MKLQKPCTLFLLAMIFCGCKGTKTTKDNLETVYPLSETQTITDISPYIDAVDFVQFEQTDNSLLGYISNLQIGRDGSLLVSDLTGRFFRFDSHGKFLNTIGRRGRGPGEYTSASSICFSEDGTKMLVLSMGKVLEYNSNDGSFIRAVDTPQKNYDEIVPSTDGGFFLSASNPGMAELSDFDTPFFSLTQFDSDGKFIEEFLPRKDFVINTALFTQSYDGSYIFRPQEGDNIVHKIDDGKVVPILRIDFEKETIPLHYIFTKTNENGSVDLQYLIRSNYYKIPIYLHDTQDYFYFSSMGPGGITHDFLYDLGRKKGIHWHAEDFEDVDVRIVGSNSTEFYAIVIKESIATYRNNPLAATNPLSRYLLDLLSNSPQDEQNDNPYLIRIKFDL